MSNPHEIRELFAWIADDPTGVHGIMAMHTQFGVMPLITSRREAIDKHRPLMQQIADQIKVPIELRTFRLVGVLDTVEPNEN